MSATLTIEIDVWCNKCGDLLSAETNGCDLVYVNPCTHCCDEARSEGYDEGHEDGSKDGY